MSRRFEFISTQLKGLYRIESKPITDQRGFFSRFFCAEELEEVGLTQPIVQINHTLTRQKGTIRGMHFQFPPYNEKKIISCLRGKILDVVVDIRKGSPTFLQWYGEVLSEENQTSIYIPEGFAHGFQTLTDNCELIYLHTEFYEPKSEGALNAKDPRLAINWPLEIVELSERDKHHAMIGDLFEGINTL